MYKVIFLIALANVNCDVIVTTKLGKVAGKEVNSIIPGSKYYSFLGIPYAKPPIGSLRFMPPVQNEGWDDVFEAKKERKPCAQFNFPERFIKQYGFCGDEDCLHLSIHTPEIPGETELNFPVIVFVHNEIFKNSHNGSKDYAPDFFMEEDVIIVTINHRLGALGFLAFGDTVLPGNNGIKDIILALKWLQENVKYFGGESSNITLMGSQGGSILVDILLRSPKTKGLISKAILQSGTSWSSMAFGREPDKKAITLSESLEYKATTSKSIIEALSNIPAENITAAELLCSHPDESRSIQRGVHPFAPVVEPNHSDAIITKYPEENNDSIDIPIMIGYNSREGIELCERFLQKPQFLTYADKDFLLLLPIRSKFHFQINDEVYFKAVQEVKDFYFDEGYVKVKKPGEYLSYMHDASVFYPIDYTIRSYLEVSTAPIYYYMFDYSGELNYKKKSSLKEAVTIDGTWGASTGDELCYLFICNPIRKIYKELLAEDESEEIKVLEIMVRLWTNFAKSGNPTPEGENFNWKPTTKSNKEILVISEELNMKTNLYEDKVRFWDNFLEKYKKIAIDGVVRDIHDEL